MANQLMVNQFKKLLQIYAASNPGSGADYPK
jgi:hypothetical protein